MSTYVVRSGDSLFKLAHRFGVSLQALEAANHLRDPSAISPGQVLQLPEHGGQSTYQGRRYTVQPGDSLYRISRRLGTSVAALAAANHLSPSATIYPGQVLTIPDAAPAPSPSPVGGTGSGSDDTRFPALWPSIQQQAAKYGADAKVMAAIIDQESTFRNLRVHPDGTGHGLIGLDDHGMLPAFEKWSGFAVGRGRNARLIPPSLQIAFLAKTLGEMTRNHGGNVWTAVREWHRGLGPRMWDAEGSRYVQLIQRHLRELF